MSCFVTVLHFLFVPQNIRKDMQLKANLVIKPQTTYSCLSIQLHRKHDKKLTRSDSPATPALWGRKGLHTQTKLQDDWSCYFTLNQHRKGKQQFSASLWEHSCKYSRYTEAIHTLSMALQPKLMVKSAVLSFGLTERKVVRSYLKNKIKEKIIHKM